MCRELTNLNTLDSEESLFCCICIPKSLVSKVFLYLHFYGTQSAISYQVVDTPKFSILG